MKGNREFTQFEANEIRKLIAEKLLASHSDQKSIRRKIRNFKFFFSDFSSKKGYTIEDFENLIITRQIKIIGTPEIGAVENPNNVTKKNERARVNSTPDGNTSLENKLMDKGNFCSIENLDQHILNSTGFYCIKLKSGSKLPERYQRLLEKRKYEFVYLGIAKGQTLRERLSQELELKSPGTFFRSIGCVLGFQPIKGHLVGNSNQNNFKFPQEDKSEIIQWLKKNIELSIAKAKDDFSIEKDLIRKYCPLLNQSHNPLKLQELKNDLDKCRLIARNN